MDKNTYETYEYLPTNSSETEPDQFFVVQGDDGTFLLNRQIQYVAQVEDVKEVLEDVQPCTVYGVSPQQFFVDVNNSSELISVSDQFILPTGENSHYTNSYLLQPSSSTTTEQMEEDVVVDQFKEPNSQDVDIDVVTHNSKQGNNFTEITLSDEQYQTLEQRGWILLESNDKIFVLNTLGLHDITSNDKLIQKLKNEIQNNTNTTGSDIGILKIENFSNQFPNIVTEPVSDRHDAVELVSSNEIAENDTIESMPFMVDNKENVRASLITKENLETSQKHESSNEPVVSEAVKHETYYDEQTSSIKIKTKFIFKDIPEKILLGKSINGKRLIAKVIKPPAKNNNIIEHPPVDNDPVFEQIAENQHYNVTGLHEADFVNLIQVTLRGGLYSSTNDQDVASADTVVTQLLKVPNLKQSLMGHNLIVTKAINVKDESGRICYRSKVTLITGRVKENEDTVGFEHIPNLLHTIRTTAEEQNISQSDDVYSCIEEKEVKENFTIFHIHITETKCPDNVVRVSVTLNKRQLPVNLIFDLKKRYPHTVFGCSACAVLFKSEEALKEHQESHCMEDDILTIDSDHSNKDEDDVIIMKTGKETVFSCAQCNIKFTRLSNIHRHMKTHKGSSQQILQTDRKTSYQGAVTKTRNKVYKCKMCPSTYYHSASLSKHIVTRHIKVKSN